MAIAYVLKITNAPRNAVITMDRALWGELGRRRNEEWIHFVRSVAPIKIGFVPPSPRHKTRNVAECDVHFLGDKLIFSPAAFDLLSRCQPRMVDDVVEMISEKDGKHYCFAPVRFHHVLATDCTFHTTALVEGQRIPLFLNQPRIRNDQALPAQIFQCRHPQAQLRLPDVFVSAAVRRAWIAEGFRGATFKAVEVSPS